uniref:Uncharacterized protein n=1 Tax=Romanomermis culicivorax TaxID=13658 RepID=A0A915IN16_ROMCU
MPKGVYSTDPHDFLRLILTIFYAKNPIAAAAGAARFLAAKDEKSHLTFVHFVQTLLQQRFHNVDATVCGRDGQRRSPFGVDRIQLSAFGQKIVQNFDLPGRRGSQQCGALTSVALVYHSLGVGSVRQEQLAHVQTALRSGVDQ